MSDMRRKNARTAMGDMKADIELKFRVSKAEKRWIESQADKLGCSVAVAIRLLMKAHSEQEQQAAEAVGA